jgi:hypothetical protein
VSQPSPPVWLEGDGFIDHNGRYYSEATVRAAIKDVNRLLKWYRSLPQSVKDEAAELAEMNDRLNRIAEEFRK